MAPKNIILKVLKYGAIFVLALFVIYMGWKVVFHSRAGEQLNSAIIELMKKDTYGGKTPEETYNMFVDALKKQDIDLAVKYFVLDPDRRIRYRQEFNEMNKNGKLKEYGEKLPEWSKWEQIKDNYNDWISQAKIEYGQVVTEPITIYDDALKEERVLQPGVYGRSIIFIKNINNLWKISSL